MSHIPTDVVFSSAGLAAYPLQKEEEATRHEQLLQQVKAKGNQPERFVRLQKEARRFADLVQDTCPDRPDRDEIVKGIIALVCDAYDCITTHETGSNIR